MTRDSEIKNEALMRIGSIDDKWSWFVEGAKWADANPYDPTPWCSNCGVRNKEKCKCGPIAENE